MNKDKPDTNMSNEWRIYAKMEANYHLSNKYALFYNMRRYYRSIGRDTFDVLPLAFHIGKGSYDPEFFVFQKVFKEHEKEAEEAQIAAKEQALAYQRRREVHSRNVSVISKHSEMDESEKPKLEMQRPISSASKAVPLQRESPLTK